MALIRQVLQHPESKRWGYVEYSDENTHHCIELGKKNFETKEEAEEYSEGFEPFSYVWSDPTELKAKQLLQRKASATKTLADIENELNQL